MKTPLLLAALLCSCGLVPSPVETDAAPSPAPDAGPCQCPGPDAGAIVLLPTCGAVCGLE